MVTPYFFFTDYAGSPVTKRAKYHSEIANYKR